MYFPKVYFPKMHFLKVYFSKVYFPKVYFLKVYFLKVYFPKTFLTQSLPNPYFFKQSVPGEVRVFRAFASLLLKATIRSPGQEAKWKSGSSVIQFESRLFIWQLSFIWEETTYNYLWGDNFNLFLRRQLSFICEETNFIYFWGDNFLQLSWITFPPDSSLQLFLSVILKLLQAEIILTGFYLWI